MLINRENIFDYILYIQTQLDIWDKKITPDTLSLLQKIYEAFVNDLPKNKSYKLTEEVVNKLHYSIISIVAMDSSDQGNLNAKIKNWHRQYEIIQKEKAFLNPLGIPGVLLDKSNSKYSLLLKSLLVLALVALGYFIYESTIQEPPSEDLSDSPTSISVNSSIHSFKVTRIDSITPVSIDITDLMDYDSIQNPSKKEFWVHQTFQFSGNISRSNGILYYDNSNFGSFQYVATKPENDTVSFLIKSKKDSFGIVNMQEVQLIAIFEKEEIANLNVFPGISYQDYPNPNRTLQFLVDNAKLEKPFLGKYKWPISLLIGVFSLLLLYFNRRKSNANKSNKKKAKFGHPYFWRIKIPDKPEIKLSELVDKKVHLLRNKIPSGRNTLNLPLTIRKTVKSGGFINFQFAEESLKTEYLFLIGYRSQSDHISKLWTEVAISLNAKDINTSVFHYNSDIRLCYNNHFPNGLSLKELYNHYSNSIVVVIGEHYNFLNPKTGKLNKWTQVFENWSTRYLLTSKNYYAWDRREDEFRKLFHVLPSKISSLPWLQIRTESSEGLKYEPDRFEHINDYNQEFTTKDIRISFTKVQRDWIAACCLFPNLHYDLSLSIGNIVFAHHDKDFSSAEIEEVFSLSWFSEGIIPDEIRKTLIKDFEDRDQKLVDKVRSFISDEVKLSYPPPGSHASDWFREGILVNEMLNKSSQPDARRREKIEKELNRIYNRGLESDIQIKPKVGEIKKPSLLLRLKRWFSKPSNIVRIFAGLTWFIIPFVILSIFFDKEECVNSFPPMDAVDLNYELGASIFEKSVKSYEIFEAVEICRTTLGRTEEDIIYDENLIRSKIFLDKFDDLQQFTDTSAFEDKYDAAFFKNISVDLLNKAIKESTFLKELTTNEIRQDSSKNADAIRFCKVVNFSQDFLEFQDDNTKHEFEDSLALALLWCEENNMYEDTLLAFGIYGLDRKDVNYNTKINFLKNNFDTPFQILNNLEYNSSESKLIYFLPIYSSIAVKYAAELSSLFNEKITAEHSSGINNFNGDFLLYIADSNPKNNTCECNGASSNNDTEPPVFITNVDDISTTTDRNDCQKTVTWQEPKVTDNCKLKQLYSENISGDYFPEGETEVLYTATDMCGNTSTMSFIVNVKCSEENTKLQVSGLVIDASSKEPIVDALIDVAGSSQNFTNEKGEFLVSMDVGLGALSVTKEGYITNTVNINSQTNNRIVLEPEIRNEKIVVYGTVKDENGKPIRNANILQQFEKIMLQPVNKTSTDSRGNFSLNISIGPENEKLLVSKSGYRRKIIEVNNSNSKNLVIVLEKPSLNIDINGSVIDDSNEKPLNGANILLKGTTTGTISESDGNFTLTIPNKKGELEFSYRGYISQTIDLESAKMPLNVRLKPDRSIIDDNIVFSLKGRVFEGKEPLIGANVLIKGTTSSTITDTYGEFQMDIPSKDATIVISYRGFQDQLIKIDTKYWDKSGDQIESLNIYMIDEKK